MHRKRRNELFIRYLVRTTKQKSFRKLNYDAITMLTKLNYHAKKANTDIAHRHSRGVPLMNTNCIVNNDKLLINTQLLKFLLENNL